MGLTSESSIGVIVLCSPAASGGCTMAFSDSITALRNSTIDFARVGVSSMSESVFCLAGSMVILLGVVFSSW